MKASSGCGLASNSIWTLITASSQLSECLELCTTETEHSVPHRCSYSLRCYHLSSALLLSPGCCLWCFKPLTSLCVCVCPCACLSTGIGSLGLESQVTGSYLVWGLGIKVQSSRRTAAVLTCWAIFAAPTVIFCSGFWCISFCLRLSYFQEIENPTSLPSTSLLSLFPFSLSPLSLSVSPFLSPLPILFFFFSLFLLWDKVSRCPGWLRTHSMSQGALELSILLLSPPRVLV